MNVLVEGQVFETDSQLGIWRVMYEVMARLAGRVDYTLWLRSPAVRPVPAGVRVRWDSGRLPSRQAQLLRKLRKLVSPSVTAPRFYRGFDVFHPSYYSDRLPPGPGGPAVVTNVYDMIAERMFRLSFEDAVVVELRRKRRAIRAAGACLAISAASAADLVAFYPEVAGRVRVVHLGGDHLTVARADPSDGAPYALFVGARTYYKNFGVVLDAMRDPAWPRGLPLWVAGAPFGEHEHVLNKVYGLADRVRPLGRVSDAELRRLYRGARCLIFPSLLEGFGLPVLEAQADGCPVVLSDIPAFREVAGDSAAYFDPRLGEALAAAVAAVQAPAARRRLTEAGYANLRRFSWDRCAEETLAVYRAAAALGPVAAGAR